MNNSPSAKFGKKWNDHRSHSIKTAKGHDGNRILFHIYPDAKTRKFTQRIQGMDSRLDGGKMDKLARQQITLTVSFVWD